MSINPAASDGPALAAATVGRSSPAVAAPESDGRRTKGAEDAVKRYMFGALGIGLVSFPILDVAALTLVQLKLLGRLAKLYDLPFSAQLSKAAIGALVAGGGSVVAARGSGRLVLRLIPAVPGWLVGMTSTAAFAGASTYALGRVFIQHFDSGGTFLTFDPERVRKFYAEAYAQGAGELQASFAGVMP